MLNAFEVMIYLDELLSMLVDKFDYLLTGFGLDMLEIFDLLVEE